jgi:hypothetical protein
MPEKFPSFFLVLGYTLQIPVAVMAIVYLIDLAHKYGYIHPVSWVLILAFSLIVVHAGYRLHIINVHSLRGVINLAPVLVHYGELTEYPAGVLIC